MAHFNIEHNGLWACFTSIADGFITRFMDRPAYERWRRQRYGRARCEPLERCVYMTMAEAVHAVFLNRSHEDGLVELRGAGLSESDIAALLSEKDSM